MKSLIAAICVAALPNLGGAESLETIFVDVTEETTIDGYLWVKRPVIVFANTDLDVNFQTQMKSLRQGAEELAARDVVVLVDANPADKTALRKKFRPRGFAVGIMRPLIQNQAGSNRARACSRIPKPITNPRFTMASARQRQKPF